jgi:FkbM family methyltransferase
MLVNILRKVLFTFIRKLERHPQFILLILNNITHFKFLLPHDKDYYGIKKIFSNNVNSFLDIGANTGTSTLAFRRMGFTNKIHLFEPNYFLFKKFLKKIKKKDSNIFIHNLALGSKNNKLNFFLPFINGKFIHYFSSFSKDYLKNSCLSTFPNKKVVIKKKVIKIKKFDDLKINERIDFVKIDTEGHDFQVIKGMKKTIKKYKPVFLIEYNNLLHYKIVKLLKNYSQYYYNLENNLLVRIKKINNTNFDRFGHLNPLSIRNIFFIHKYKKY